MNTDKDKITTPKILAVIPAKSESRRLTDKNICMVYGKPMLSWALIACNESRYKIETWLSSDSNEILKIGVQYGATPYKRDVKLCLDYVEKFLVIKDVITHINNIYPDDRKPQVVISLQPNSPQIRGEDLDRGIDLFLKSNKNEIFSVNSDLMQDGAFRIMKWDYVLRQETLSTQCGAIVCNLIDVHTPEDINRVEAMQKNKDDILI